jgi:hypothetical protein
MTEATVAFAALITALATLVSVSAAGYVAVKSLKRTELKVTAIDHAVHGAGPAASTIRENVQDLHDGQFPQPIAPLVRQIAEQIAALIDTNGKIGLDVHQIQQDIEPSLLERRPDPPEGAPA